MHLLAAQPGAIADGSEAVDLGQTPGEIVVLSAADTELAMLADARAGLPADGFPTLRLANLMQLGHNMSVDLYCEEIVAKAKVVVVRLLGGRGYWPYGVEQISETCRQTNIPVAFLPGDDQPDAELAELSTLPADTQHRLWQYCVHGGPENALDFLHFAATLIGVEADWQEPRPLVRAGLHWPGAANTDLARVQSNWTEGAPVAALVFYRALVQAGNLWAVEAMIEGLAKQGLNPLPVFVASLKDPIAAATLETLLVDAPPDVILNATGFAYSPPGIERVRGPYDCTPGDDGECEAGPPVLQIVFSGGNADGWREGMRGLSARDIAMNVALPEVDGRVLTRAVSFKGLARRDPLTETDIVRYEPVADRVDFVCALTKAWADLRRTPPEDRRIGLVLANYPNRDGRIGNGVGLDTPAGAVEMLRAMHEAGYNTGDIPADGEALIARMLAGPTNDLKNLAGRDIAETLSLAEYQIFLGELPDAVVDAVTERWGTPESDPFFMPGEVDCGRFAIPAFRLGNVAVGLQPARGYNIDPKETYHDPDLVPPHNYLAFHAWLRHSFRAHAVIHFGKHGNLEWLPGKALALSENCFPEAALGPLPNIYPFIVNDPGEGTQAKRRTSAVIVDHLTPPLTRAESYGPLKDLEQLVDEYYEAAGVDPRRLKVLRRDILDLCRVTGLDTDCGIIDDDNEDAALGKLDNYLCDLKEMQIRDGLHVFGKTPDGRLLTDLLVALVRVPRGNGEGGDASLHRALAGDMGLAFDPLDCEMGATWDGPKPTILEVQSEDPWRSAGDTVERLESLSGALVSSDAVADAAWVQTQAVLDTLNTSIRPAVEACGDAELTGALTALDGRFLEPGTSGAPTRGRPDVLPTGRNFYSVDTRTVPTPAAWKLGWKSATLLVERHMQEHGTWLKTVALSAWGTSNMRTGGDDIAQALALMGVQPTWDTASRRVTGFEVMPASVLDRPRVDVTLRVSGFFRDAFPALIDLFDSAARAVAAVDEMDDVNPAAERSREETKALMAQGLDGETAERRAGYRVFGSMPGAYGAGLQALIDEKGWETDADLARAYVAWGGYAYGAGTEGQAEHGLFEARLKSVEAVIQNQDNREHDILDSDDYYQFEGGMTAAVRHLSGTQPAAYHMDHSRPETPRARTLEEEVARVVRARVVNPKWIEGVMRHGYKGAFEMAATVDYLFAFAATAHCVRDHHFDAVFEAYLDDEQVRDFLEKHNPAALREMSARLQEAQDRGLWKPRRNDTRDTLQALMA
ncbi:MAG: cobaltochelatase subunit CobN [Rhodospirillaceae bacterium]|nr:cobaltochelatase subunit CobN [Rhodospirillaceae bacterium]